MPPALVKPPIATGTLSPCELEIELFCQGIRIEDPSILEDGRGIFRTRAGLGSGLELVLPRKKGDIWVNIPVEEDFVENSPFEFQRNGRFAVLDTRSGHSYPVKLPEEPAWYRDKTSKGITMSRVGVLQGTYLGIYISNSCSYWYRDEAENCRFCTTGYNVGINEMADKDVDDVVEVCSRARDDGATFVHFNSGYQNGRDLDIAAPYIRAVKEKVGMIVGVQLVPTMELWKYDWLIDLGADHFSFCYEFHNPEYFRRLLPGKERTVGQKTFFRALEYTAKKMHRGAVSGEIIAGAEPLEDTLKAIDYITSNGAFPTVCIFRPTIGSDMEDHPAPSPKDMKRVFRHLIKACEKAWIPIGAAPNIEVSLITQPTDCLDFPHSRIYDWYLSLAKTLARPYWKKIMKPRGSSHKN